MHNCNEKIEINTKKYNCTLNESHSVVHKQAYTCVGIGLESRLFDIVFAQFGCIFKGKNLALHSTQIVELLCSVLVTVAILATAVCLSVCLSFCRTFGLCQNN